MKILVFVGSTLEVKFRSGIQRLVGEVAMSLGKLIDVDFVKWDPIEGQLRYLDVPDLARLFSVGVAPTKPHRLAQRVQYRFGDTIANPEETWLLFPEISHHQEHGNEIFARIIAQAKEYRIRTAVIFYDIIPITNSVYEGARDQHISYVAQLLRCDLIIPISVTSARALEEYYRAELGPDCALACSGKIVPVLLPEINSETPPLEPADTGDGRDIIIMVGTVEPRKRQVEALQAITQLQASGIISLATEIHVYGSLHPFVSGPFNQVLESNPQIKYFKYATADVINASYKRAMFSIFASSDEGYGLPIAESLARGVPCLTANYGAMAEVASGGGCLTCDVNDQGALTEAIRTLFSDGSVRARLRAEIGKRPFRDWNTYCQDVVNILVAHGEQAADAGRELESALRNALSSETETETNAGNRKIVGTSLGAGGRLVVADRVAETSPVKLRRPSYTISRLTGDACDGADLDDETASHAFAADLLGVGGEATVRALVGRARDLEFAALLPSEVVEEPDQTKLNDALASLGAKAILEEERRVGIAADEHEFQQALRHWKANVTAEAPLLAVVLSTYNRAAFIEANVTWLVRAAKTIGDIWVIVVDNASTDDTALRLAKFRNEPCFSLIVNSQNTGMLGNLHICSTLFAARHVWLTGDDDFIIPEQLGAILKILREDPGLPLACANFAVYYRDHLMPGDNARTLIAEGIEIAGSGLRSGIYPANVIATQHDNLFTAIYAMIFRSDLLAACFNYPFDGRPFGTLTECVPSTKWVLENYRYVDCYWHAPVSIVGNGHNSWSHHRPRWHGVLMPQVFELARDAGADPAILHKFAQLHIDLYEEAIGIAHRSNTPLAISPADLAPARRVFRRELSLTENGSAF